MLCDVKHTTEEGCRTYFGHSLQVIRDFLALCESMRKEVVLRHVVVPDLTDNEEGIRRLSALAKEFSVVKKTELLPFHKMCEEKYERLGIPFPLKDTPPCTAEHIQRLQKLFE